jgi:hypothetical protein
MGMMTTKNYVHTFEGVAMALQTFPDQHVKVVQSDDYERRKP